MRIWHNYRFWKKTVNTSVDTISGFTIMAYSFFFKKESPTNFPIKHLSVSVLTVLRN